MKSSKAVAQRTHARHHNSTLSLAWLFRSNLPPRRGMPLPNDVRKRNFFGVGEIVGVLANPGGTLKSLTEARKALDDARTEIQQSRERAQIRPTHTFSPLPTFFPRAAETRVLERILSGPPAFTVLFGASSVGKTALLRQVLSREEYHCLHFDMRIAGFSDLASLYASLSGQMEMYFEVLSGEEGYAEFEKESWAFKHDRLNVEKMIDSNGAGAVKVSDIARLMELFQSSLLRYWKHEHKPTEKVPEESDEARVERKQSTKSLNGKGKKLEKRRVVIEQKDQDKDDDRDETAETQPRTRAHTNAKKVPVLFIDEAHKLPTLVQSPETMRCLLDAMLVLTKQDRLCHVVHATSDSFYMAWLRRMNVVQHCKILCISDCSKRETRAFFDERLVPSVPEDLRETFVDEFDEMYEAFGGRLVQWTDYVGDYINSEGSLPITSSAHYQEAYLLLNLLLLHASENDEAEEETRSTLRGSDGPGSILSGNQASRRMKTYSPTPPSPFFSPPSAGVGAGLGGGVGSSNDVTSMLADDQRPAFTAPQLLAVLRALTTRETAVTGANLSDTDVNTDDVDQTLALDTPSPADAGVAYFPLCRAMGVRAVDGMVRAGAVEIRWANPVGADPLDPASSSPAHRWRNERAQARVRVPDSVLGSEGGSAMFGKHPFARPGLARRESDALSGAGGPRLVPVSPIMRNAMRAVVKEWEGERNVGRDTIFRGGEDGGADFGIGSGVGLAAGMVRDRGAEGSVEDGASDYASIMESDIVEY